MKYQKSPRPLAKAPPPWCTQRGSRAGSRGSRAVHRACPTLSWVKRQGSGEHRAPACTAARTAFYALHQYIILILLFLVHLLASFSSLIADRRKCDISTMRTHCIHTARTALYAYNITYNTPRERCAGRDLRRVTNHFWSGRDSLSLPSPHASNSSCISQHHIARRLVRNTFYF